MNKIEITKVSSKGQVVLPKSIREKFGIKKGSLLAITRAKKDLIVLKKIKSPILKEDLKTLVNIEKAWEEMEKGRFKKATKTDFLSEMSKL